MLSTPQAAGASSLHGLRYDYEIEKLWAGATYANLELFTRTDTRSNLAGMWSAKDDQFYCGRWILSFYCGEDPIPPVHTTFMPVSQATHYQSEDIEVQKTYFVPFGTDELDACFVLAKLRNFADEPRRVELRSVLQYPQFVWQEFVKIPEMSQKNKQVKSWTDGNRVMTATVGDEDEVRILDATAPLISHAFDSKTATLAYEAEVPARGETEVVFRFLISHRGVEDALRRLDGLGDVHALLEESVEHMAEILRRSDVLCPDPVITRATKWAKVNLLREEKRYPIGYGFTNDPPQDILVIRDAAWFCLGSDYVTSDFSAQLCDLVQEYGVEETGELTEYIMACETPPYRSNYGLNINDDTPLMVFAVHHHYSLTGDEDFLRRTYPMVKGACEWILQQMRHGLVWCSSEEANVWGISGWRNIIPNYQISGAVTEINAECYMALRLGGRCAQAAGYADDARRFLDEALALKEAINKRLVSEKTGVYVLNIDNDGVPHHQITGDLVFPALFGVASDGAEADAFGLVSGEMRGRILNLLFSDEFWTEYGVRTVSRTDQEYDPEFGVRLMGGIWPNLTAWVAYAARVTHPDKMVEAMRNIYRISEAPDPAAHKAVVPGQFPECLHGENFQSRGMVLSPWMPPTYLWLVMDGLLGLYPTVDQLEVNPHLPSDWQWVAVKNVPYRQGLLSFFAYAGVIHTNREFKSGYQVEVWDEDISGQIECNAYAIAFRRGRELMVFVGAPERQGVTLCIPANVAGQELRYEWVLGPSEAAIVRYDGAGRDRVIMLS